MYSTYTCFTRKLLEVKNNTKARPPKKEIVPKQKNIFTKIMTNR